MMNSQDDLENQNLDHEQTEQGQRTPISAKRKFVRVVWVTLVSYGGAAMFGMFGLLMLAFSSAAGSGKDAAQMVTLAMIVATTGLFIVTHIPIIGVLLDWSFDSVIVSFVVSGALGVGFFIVGFVMVVVAVS